MSLSASLQVTPKRPSFDEVLNRTLDRNTPTVPFHQRRETDLEKFDKETKRLYYEFNEQQRQKMAVFERDYFLDNIDQIDDGANYQSVPDLEERRKLQDESYQIKHTYNMRKESLTKKLQKEETEFWTHRNGERAKLLMRLDENALHGFSLPPRSRSSSVTPSPARTPAGTPNASRPGTSIGTRCQTPTARSYSNAACIIPQQSQRYEKPRTPSGFFLPKYTSISRQNKIGLFPKQRKVRNSFENDYEIYNLDQIRHKVKKTTALNKPPETRREYTDETLKTVETFEINGESESDVQIPDLE